MTDTIVSNPSILAARRSSGALGGTLLALGGVGVFATSVLYALCSPDVLPTPALDTAAATRGVIASSLRMRAAGSIGVTSDVVSVMAILLLLLEPSREKRGLAAAGWAGLLLGTVIFTLVDTMFGFVLVPLGIDGDAAQAYLGARRLFDALFLVGTAFVGFGLLGLVAGSMAREPGARLGRGLNLGVAAVGAMALVCAIGSFAGLPLQQGAGVAILLTGLLWALLGAGLRRDAVAGAA